MRDIDNSISFGKYIDQDMLKEENMELLLDNLDKHHLLVAKNNSFSQSELINFCQKFGELLKLGFNPHPGAGNHYIQLISNDPNQGYHTYIDNDGFHIDGVEHIIPAKYCIFYCQSAIKDGNTHFIRTNQLYNSLDNDKKKEWSRLWMILPRFKNNKLYTTAMHPFIHKLNTNTDPYSFCCDQLTKKYANVFNNTVCPYFILKEEIKGKLFKRLSKIDEENKINNINNYIENFANKNPNNELVYEWEKGDLLFMSNLTLMHKASNKTQNNINEYGLRLLYRICIKGNTKLISESNSPSIMIKDIPIVQSRLESRNCIVGDDYQEIYIYK